jgi:ubiquinone/menaquinone biosynthesis C-methylase UbiE
MVEIAAARMPHARVIRGDVPPLPFDDGEYDRIFTSLFFHHLSSDGRAEFIAEARRVARELVVVEDLRRPNAPADETHEFVLDDGSHHRMHRHSFTAAELVAELAGGHVLHKGRWFVVVATS